MRATSGCTSANPDLLLVLLLHYFKNSKIHTCLRKLTYVPDRCRFCPLLKTLLPVSCDASELMIR